VSRALVALAAGVLVLGGCTAEAPPPGEAQIDVDTPQLRQAKADAGVADCRPGDGSPVEGGLPDVTLPCLGGGTDVGLGSLRGPLVVNLFASWCGPCREEMPVIERFHQQHGDRVAVLGIDYEDPQVAAAMSLVSDTGVTYPLLADPQARLQGAGPFPGRMGLPMFAFVDEDGRATVMAGQVESVEELEGLVSDHLGVPL
jgi:thiol-disulfide isomerase/thioredoxin